MLAAGVAGALLSGTRVTGISFLALYTIQVLRDFFYSRRVKAATWIGLFVFPIGLITFSIFLFFTIRDPFGYVTIQKAWGFGNLSFIDWLFDISSSGSVVPLAYLASIVVALGGGIYFLTRKSYTEAFILLIPVMTSVVSVAINFRYFFVLYPFYLIFSRLITSNKWLKFPVYAGTVATSIFAINAWLNGAGYLV
jgi:hypothetical protein